MFNYINLLRESKYCHDSKKSLVGKMKDETGDIAIKEFAELKPKIYQFLIDENSEHKNQRVFEKNVGKINRSNYV